MEILKSRRKILAAFNRKNIPVEHVTYRTCVAMDGWFARGWQIEISDHTEERLYNAGFSDLEIFNQYGTTAEVLEWVARMPVLDKLTKQGPLDE